jgi:hypothetical protein
LRSASRLLTRDAASAGQLLERTLKLAIHTVEQKPDALPIDAWLLKLLNKSAQN